MTIENSQTFRESLEQLKKEFKLSEEFPLGWEIDRGFNNYWYRAVGDLGEVNASLISPDGRPYKVTIEWSRREKARSAISVYNKRNHPIFPNIENSPDKREEAVMAALAMVYICFPAMDLQLNEDDVAPLFHTLRTCLQ
ncbi:MAG: hypothetical protein UT34_C0001G0030 [candidate division WS6 bacterium GW2011_GWF2_39_15]|uniref:Uncharacterized protein n=1 Tax=candidate division WS6 bacterium GW2011_GWF2_39_15 TaxID=1619100 RepID=A0A0G0Q6E2_9BACT|nr:MAG: hypothetical protein UT34_C0001G0030 [candidate division WS6 bacterium GW2011_GWF2_39_15]